MRGHGGGKRLGLAAFVFTALALYLNVRFHPTPRQPVPGQRTDPAAGSGTEAAGPDTEEPAPKKVRKPFDRKRLLADIVDGTVIFVVTTTLWLATYAFAPRVLGWQPRAVISGSMMPSIRPGDVVVVRPGLEGITPGTLVTFNDPAQPGRVLTHRVLEVNDDGTLTTKGDANRTPDSTPLQASRVIGQPRLVVPLIGLPAYWRLEGRAPPSALAGGVILVLLLVSRRFLRPSTPEGPTEPVASAQIPEQRSSGEESAPSDDEPVAEPAAAAEDPAEEDPPEKEESWESASASS